MRNFTSYKKGHEPWIKGRIMGARTKSVNRKISDANIEYWRKKTEEFLSLKPICKSCGNELTNFSRLMLCEHCRCYKNHQAFKGRNPKHSASYSRAYKKRKRAKKRQAESFFPLMQIKSHLKWIK